MLWITRRRTGAGVRFCEGAQRARRHYDRLRAHVAVWVWLR